MFELIERTIVIVATVFLSAIVLCGMLASVVFKGMDCLLKWKERRRARASATTYTLRSRK